jgi:hypothetical protein
VTVGHVPSEPDSMLTETPSPRHRSVQLATAAAIGAMLAIAILQLLLVTGALKFDIQVVLVMATFLLVSTWVLTVSSTGRRRGTLPRRVTPFGLLLASSSQLRRPGSA